MVKNEMRLYESQWDFSAKNEITPEQAQTLRSFVRAHLVDGKVEHAETIYPPDRIELVVYYDQTPSEALVKRHQARYGQTRLSISLPKQREGEYTISELYEYDSEGVLLHRERCALDKDEWPQREWHYDRANVLYEIVEYEYDENGDVVSRSFAPDGTLMHEDHPWWYD